MNSISLTPGDWPKLRQILQRMIIRKLFVPQIKKGTSQADAGAAADELWVDTTDNTVKLGR